MSPSSIRLFIKPYCGWCHEAIVWLDAHDIAYTKLDVTNDADAWNEMVELTGQSRAPCIDVDGEVLADFGADELEAFWNRLKSR